MLLILKLFIPYTSYVQNETQHQHNKDYGKVNNVRALSFLDLTALAGGTFAGPATLEVALRGAAVAVLGVLVVAVLILGDHAVPALRPDADAGVALAAPPLLHGAD